MRAKHIAVALTGLFVGLVAVQPSGARVVELVIEQRTSFVGGADWGKAGPYEMLRGTAYMEADPNNPARRSHRRSGERAAQCPGTRGVQHAVHDSEASRYAAKQSQDLLRRQQSRK